ncbi:GTP cyclohydrolase I FolE2 [Desulfurococcaceae archaeon MEX13E-LK6-19]|nr:GTP cyclohydrolase I FolE2 [Desulfurococcaceae archaeon MEX13E-LK6-19]
MKIDKKEIPDIQDSVSPIPLPLSRVGVSNIERRIVIGDNHYDVVLSVYIHLPESKRGAHLSRLIRVIDETVEDSYKGKYGCFKDFINDLGQKLLETHSYTQYVDVVLETKHYTTENLNPLRLVLEARINRNNGVKYKTTIIVKGLTACPCAQAVFGTIENIPLENAPTHMQRTLLKVSIESANMYLDINKLVSLLNNSFSVELKSYLDRITEYKMIKKALSNPSFAEDVARKVLKNLYEYLSQVGRDDDIIGVYVESYDSIHPHNVVVETKYTLKELRRFLENKE